LYTDVCCSSAATPNKNQQANVVFVQSSCKHSAILLQRLLRLVKSTNTTAC
jgi:hypothetical protein